MLTVFQKRRRVCSAPIGQSDSSFQSYISYARLVWVTGGPSLTTAHLAKLVENVLAQTAAGL